MALCCRYSSGGKTPAYDAADAFVALCTAILHAEGACRAAIDGDPFLKESEGLVWVPSIPCSQPGRLGTRRLATLRRPAPLRWGGPLALLAAPVRGPAPRLEHRQGDDDEQHGDAAGCMNHELNRQHAGLRA